MTGTRKNNRLLIFLIAASLAMAFAMFMLTHQDKQQLTTGMDTDGITRIAISNSEGVVVRLEKQSELWQVVEPETATANMSAVEPLLSVAGIPPAYESHEVNRDAAGIAQAQTTITFNDKQFLIGELDVSEKRRYVESDGMIYFFPEWIKPLIDGGAGAFINAQP